MNDIAYCSLVRSDDLKIGGRFGDGYVCLKTLGYGDINVDALWKWSAILSIVHALYNDRKKEDLSFVEIGGGLSPIHHILSTNFKIANVDRNYKDNWFPTAWLFYSEAQSTPTKSENITYVQRDFNAYAASLEPCSIDLFIDCCSIIHFDKQNKLGFHNDGCAIAGQYIYEALKPGGRFITACDVAHPRVMDAPPQWLTPLQLKNCYTAAGFDLLRPVDMGLDPLYVDPAKAVVTDGKIPHTKLTTATTGRPMEELHMHKADDGVTLLSAVFTFEKPQP